jgi:hypothetical protein
MRGAVMYGPHDVRVEERPEPQIIELTDAVILLSATCVRGSDLWPYRGLDAFNWPAAMGHEYVGIVEEVGSEVSVIAPGQFVIGSFFASDNTCELCRAGYQSACIHRESVGAEARRPSACACHSQTARLSPRRTSRRMTSFPASWLRPTRSGAAGSVPSLPRSARARRSRSSATARSACSVCCPSDRSTTQGGHSPDNSSPTSTTTSRCPVLKSRRSTTTSPPKGRIVASRDTTASEPHLG